MRCSAARTQVVVRTVGSPRRSIHPVRPFGRSGSTTRPQWPPRLVRTTHNQVGEPSGVVPATWATTGPPGRECTIAPPGAAASRNRGGSAARAVAGASMHSAASATAIATIVLRR